MSNSQSIIAFKGPIDETILDPWGSLELIESNSCGDDYKAAWAWAAGRDGYVEGKSDAEMCPLVARDGEYNILIDFSMLMAVEEDALIKLSQHTPVYVAVTQGTAGCASFACYRDSARVRSIDFVDGDIETQGDPLPEEEGIDLASFYDVGLENLWRKLGFSGLLFTGEFKCFTAFHCRDLSATENEVAIAPPLRDEKPWWKLW